MLCATKEAWINLNNTTYYNWEWTTQDGYSGRKVTSNTDNSKSIFLPAAGYVNGTLFKNVGSYGYYWSGTAYSRERAYYLNFYSEYVNAENKFGTRCYGYSVRPVRLVAVN